MNTPDEHEPRSPLDTPLEKRSRELFDASVTNLDAHTRSQLNQARHMAMQASQQRARLAWRWLVPAGSVAALALVTVVTMNVMRPAVAPATPEDVDIVAVTDNLELLQNDMEFYDWLGSSDDASASGSS